MYRLHPQSDMSYYEFIDLLAHLNFKLSEDAYLKLRPGTKRHFEKVKELHPVIKEPVRKPERKHDRPDFGSKV